MAGRRKGRSKGRVQRPSQGSRTGQKQPRTPKPTSSSKEVARIKKPRKAKGGGRVRALSRPDTTARPPAKSKGAGRRKGKQGGLGTTPLRRRLPAPKHVLSLKTRVQLRESLTLLRKHVHGYENRDGYSLSHLDRLDTKTRRRIIRRAATLKELTAVPHDTIKAITKKERHNLNLFTKQRIRNAKHFIVHKPSDQFTTRLHNGNVEIEGKFGRRVISRSQFFLFPRRPRYPKELVAMARKLQKDMPQGFYTVLTAAHGDTGEPFERDQIINRLNEYLAAYEVDEQGRATGFSEALVGFRFMSTTLDGASVQRRQVSKRRERQKEFNAKQRAAAIKVERKKVRLKKRRKPRRGK